jgi:hypothetical protein
MVDKPLKSFYLRSAPGANEEAGFFSDKAGDIRSFGGAGASWGPEWPILAHAALFLCHAGAWHYKLKRSVSGTGRGPDWREAALHFLIYTRLAAVACRSIP